MADYFKIGTFDEKSWHGKEQFLLDHNNIWDAMCDTGMDKVEFVKGQSYILHKGEFLPVLGKFQLAIVGADWNNGAVPFGRQITSYEPLQHKYMAELLQPVIDMSNGQIGLKGLAVVGKLGETTFIQLDLGEFQVGGFEQETHQSYLLLADNKLKGATHFLTTNVRTVCQNTYAQAVNDMPPIPHGANGTMFLEFHAAMLERTLRLKQEEQLLMEQLFNTSITKDQVERALVQVFPEPKPTPAMRKASEVEGDVNDGRILKVIEKAEKDSNVNASLINLAKTRRESTMLEFEKFNDEYNYAANTAYGFFNSVTNTVSHSTTFTGDVWKQTLAQLFLGGQKNTMTQVALEQAKEMAGIS